MSVVLHRSANRRAMHRPRPPRFHHHHPLAPHWVLVWWCCWLIVTLAPQPAHGTIVASSKISYCTDAGDDALNCTRKMIVTMTVEAGQLAGEESIVFLNSATDETTAAASAANAAADATTVSFSPIAITTSRSAVRYRYPVFYVQNYNAKPYEATVRGRLLNQCNADFDPNTATCGLAYDATGTAIPSSQGFCCDCSMCQTLGFCNADARANSACNVFDAYTTASCLRFGERWYSGYTIGTYVTWFTLNITVTRNTTSTGASGAASAAATVVQQAVQLQLSPSVLGDTAGDGWGASARIVGSFAPADQPLDLTSHMLFAPALPLNDERGRAGAGEWMLLPSSLVSLDGRECNKVGVSYEAFASQGNRCNLSPGSCLSSQLEDYRTADLARIAAGRRAQYMASGYGAFDLERVPNATASTTAPYISYVAASPAATMIVLTVDADDLDYIVGVATGVIVSARLNNDTLTAGSRDGVLAVVVRNTAAVTGRLVVSVQNCSVGVFPIPAQTLSLAAAQQSSLLFRVYMQSAVASGAASCAVVVRNAEEAITDSVLVSWTVRDTDFHNGTQGGTANSGGGGSVEEPSAATCDRCGTLNIVCAFQRTCWQLILLDLLVYLVIAAVVVGVIWFRRVLCCCFYGRGGGGDRSTKNQHHDSDDRRSRSRTGSRGDGEKSRRHANTSAESGLQLPRTYSASSLRGSPSTPQLYHAPVLVAPQPLPPMVYATHAAYAEPAAYVHSRDSSAAVMSPPFVSPLRARSLPLPAPPPHPPLLPTRSYAFYAPDSPSGLASPSAMEPGTEPAVDVSSRRASRASRSRDRWAVPRSPGAVSPDAPPFSARGGVEGGWAAADESGSRYYADGSGMRGDCVLRPAPRSRSRPSSPSPSVVRSRYAPFT